MQALFFEIASHTQQRMVKDTFSRKSERFVAPPPTPYKQLDPDENVASHLSLHCLPKLNCFPGQKHYVI